METQTETPTATQTPAGRLAAVLGHSYTLLLILVMLGGFVATAATRASHAEDSIATLAATQTRHEEEIRALRGRQDEIVAVLYTIKGTLDSIRGAMARKE